MKKFNFFNLTVFVFLLFVVLVFSLPVACSAVTLNYIYSPSPWPNTYWQNSSRTGFPNDTAGNYIVCFAIIYNSNYAFLNGFSINATSAVDLGTDLGTGHELYGTGIPNLNSGSQQIITSFRTGSYNMGGDGCSSMSSADYCSSFPNTPSCTPPVTIIIPSSNYNYQTSDTMVYVQGACPTNGSNELTLQTSYTFPLNPYTTCDCVAGNYFCPYNFQTYGAKQICVIDNTDTSKYACNSFTLSYQTLNNSPSLTYFMAVSKYDYSLGSPYFLQYGSDNYDYYSGENWGSYTTSTLPFAVFPVNIATSSTAVKLQVDEISASTTPFNILNTVSDNTLASTTWANINYSPYPIVPAAIFTSDLTTTATKNYLIKLYNATSTVIYDSKIITIRLLSNGNNLNLPITNSNKLFKKTVDVLRTKLLFAQFYSFYDNLIAAVNATSSAPVAFSMKFPTGSLNSSGIGSTTSAVVLDFSATSTTGLIANGFRPYEIASLWILFALYVFTRVKTLFSSDEED